MIKIKDMGKSYPVLVLDSAVEVDNDLTTVGVEIIDDVYEEEVVFALQISSEAFNRGHSFLKEEIIKAIEKGLKDIGTSLYVSRRESSPEMIPEFPMQKFSCFGYLNVLVPKVFTICASGKKNLSEKEVRRKAQKLFRRYLQETYPVEKETERFIEKTFGFNTFVQANLPSFIASFTASIVPYNSSYSLFVSFEDCNSFVVNISNDTLRFSPKVFKTFAFANALRFALYKEKVCLLEEKASFPSIGYVSEFVNDERIKNAYRIAYLLFIASSFLATSSEIARFFKEKTLKRLKAKKFEDVHTKLGLVISKLQVFYFLKFSGYLTKDDFKSLTEEEKEFLKLFEDFKNFVGV